MVGSGGLHKIGVVWGSIQVDLGIEENAIVWCCNFILYSQNLITLLFSNGC
ncbi:hypothetical protein SAMN04488116_3443 [Flagellimonas flava]|uniref:Uncharacterized protein n=1 Tax=Flagellimonas flava TaxID=570519 RepID=A0A1M5Q0X1_9FLAO|nr:hypothetical protein SAMN04488116_3443 [Allomuricauda flava]